MQFDSDAASTAGDLEGDGQVSAPRNRWAQRAEGQTLMVKHQDGKTVDVSPGELLWILLCSCYFYYILVCLLSAGSYALTIYHAQYLFCPIVEVCLITRYLVGIC